MIKVFIGFLVLLFIMLLIVAIIAIRYLKKSWAGFKTLTNRDSYNIALIERGIVFEIDNTGFQNTKQILRIGSIAGKCGAFMRLNMSPSATDNSVIRDQYGAGCLGVQGFSEITSFNSIIINEIHIISSSAEQQTKPLVHKTIYPNLWRKSKIDNSDVRQMPPNIKIHKLNCELSSIKFLEYEILDNTVVTIVLCIDEIENTKLFSKLL